MVTRELKETVPTRGKINKYVEELYAKYYAMQFAIPIVSIRIFNTYGPGEMPGKYRNVIPNFIEKALNNEELTITGDGAEIRDFTYVDDTVTCLKLAATSDYSTGEFFNAGTSTPITISHLAKTIIKLCKSDSKIAFTQRRSWGRC